jgi:HEXXH motif-containing protein
VDANAERIVRLIDTDPDQTFRAVPAPPERAAGCQSRLEAALALIEAGDPELAAEIRTLVSDIVLGAAPLERGVMQFEGASSFMLWGAMLLNAGDTWTTLGAAQALAHESGHTLLFGHCIDGKLVENDAEARFSSPLRADPRPMEGIFHATYVTARMYRCVAKLLAARVLDRAMTEEATTALSAHRRGFDAGLSVIERDAHLTPLGREVIDGARRFMAAPTV